MTKKPQLCDMCGEPMKRVTMPGRKSVYVCVCGERVKVREGMITAAK
jgi:formamidopyrimidine-DNA glycosylase